MNDVSVTSNDTRSEIRDGMLGGLNIEATLGLAERLRTPVIASGGVGALDDLRQVREAARSATGRTGCSASCAGPGRGRG